MTPGTIEAALEQSLDLVYDIDWPTSVRERLFGPPGHPSLPSVAEAYAAVSASGADPIPPGLVPLAVVDERSLACIVVESDPRSGLELGEVVRWHLDEVPLHHQAALLDVDPLLYVKSVEDELNARGPGLAMILDEIGPAYEAAYIENAKRPRDHIVRPVRIACQNVIVGLAAFAQDSTFDGLSVPAWQTCEVPHVATHEANRALAALTLCDAFRNGGTMEIRFDREARMSVKGRQKRFDGHPERRVPASLRRFGRTVGVALGAEDPQAITPAEARELFLAITPMPADLWQRVEDAVARRGIAPERICFLLLSQVWREIEMDYLLATTSRAPSILRGGARWTDRVARQAESEICRGALMTGMLHRRLNSTDAAVGDGEIVRVVEDRARGVTWRVDADRAAIVLDGIDEREPVPWTLGLSGVRTLTVFPRTAVTAETVAAVRAADVAGHRALLLPNDAPVPTDGSLTDGSLTVLRCPDRLADLDRAVEDRLLTARISRG